MMDHKRTHQVFVYGTLLVGESNHHIVSPHLLHVQPGHVCGRLCDADAGRYPALVLDPIGERIAGEWFTVTEAGLARLDELEEYFGPHHPDNLYERVWVQDAVSGCEGFVYVWESFRDCEAIPEGSWRSYRMRRG